MELQDYVRVIRKRWRIIAAATLVVIAGAAAVTVVSPPTYEAQTQLFVSTSGTADATQLLQGSNFTQQRVKSYADVITSPRVLNPVIDQLHLKVTADDLAKNITATVPLDTVLIQVAVDDRNAEQAARIADALGKQFTTTVSEIETVSASAPSPVKVSVMQQPTVPLSPVSPKPVRNIGLGLVLGLLVGVGLALLRDLLDTTIKNEQDVAQVTKSAVIGGIAYDADAPKRPLIVQADPHSPRAEAFRALRTNLQFVDAANQPRSIVFTSSLPGEGKTTTTANLAITLAAAGSRVCVVEGDLRRPRMLDYMGMEGAVGLTNVLIGQAHLDDVLQRFANTEVWVLGCGPIPPNPSELLGSTAMLEVVRQLEAKFDYVIIDAPPLLPVTDAAVLSTVTGGTVVVVGTGSTTREQLSRSIQSVEAVNGQVLGVVLNKLPEKGGDGYYYYRDGYAPISDPDRQLDLRSSRGHQDRTHV
ncbi:polysaccharide biosynthesis tyrosine autokinase [Oryzihumus sp.]|uniref:polysaccharide biosynthesis tyrosine autokinase n=1 Tax=Oryzihumus sp. TaxID=1968903 RepID=UPI002EDAFA66